MRRIFSAVTVVALGALIPFVASGQGSLTIGNYQLVEEVQKVTRTISDFRYKADVINTTGIARPTLTATLTSNVATVQAVQATLHFVNVPGNGSATSTDTFIIRVDRSVTFDFANLVWTFPPIDAPVANAGPDQTVARGATVTLNGSASTNPSGLGTLTYSWVFTARPVGSTATLTNPTSVTPTFVADIAGGSYIIQLTVSNGVPGVPNGTDLVIVNTNGNSAPVANAGPNQTVPLGATVTLNGAGSTDADGNPLTFAWTLTGKPAGSTATLTGANTVSPTFVADKSTINTTPYTVQLVVNDGTVNSTNTAIVTISTQNTPPVAVATGPAGAVNVGAVAQLNGSGSTDADSDPLTYLWSLTTRPANSTAALSSTTTVNPTFTVDKEGQYVAQLVVNDGKVNSNNTATVTVTTNTVQAPTANAGANQTVHGGTVTLHGSGTDPQGFPLTFQWSLTTKPAGSTAVLVNPTSATPTFVADVLGTYVAQLIVNNGFLNSAPATVTIVDSNTPPATNAGPDQNVAAGATVTLSGNLTTDPDNDPITYVWSFTSRPAGSTATLTGSTTISPTFVADVVGPFVVQLIASDPFQSGAPDTVTINAQPSGAIILPATTNVGLGASTAFPVTLSSAAPAGGTTVTLVITDATKVSLSTLSVFIVAGASAPATQPQVSGLNLGSSVVTASSTTHTGTTGNVVVSATATLTPTPLNIVGTATQSLTLTLSALAPAGGVTFTLSSSNPAAATVPATVTIPQGFPVVAVPVTGVAPGAATISATATGVTVTPANVTVVALLSITTTSPLPAGQVGTPYSQTLAAAGGTLPLTWAQTAGTLPAGLNFNTATGQIAGTPTGPAVTSTPLTFRVTDSGTPPQTATVNLTLSINPPTLGSITATGGDNQSAPINTAFAAPLAATVKDTIGNPVPGMVVTFTVVPVAGAGGSFAGGVTTTTATTDASGVATSPIFTANATTGSYTPVASVQGVGPAAVFHLTNTPGPAASITATGGSGQSTLVGSQFPAPLAATVRDAGNNPVPNVTVTFTINVAGAGGGFAGGVNTAVTNASGVATSPIITANGTQGQFTVNAAAPGVASPAVFTLTNVTLPPDSVSATSGTPQAAFVNSAFSAPLVATAKDAAGNPVAGVTILFTVNESGPGAGGNFAGGVNTAVTNGLGVATSPVFTANGTGGSYTVTASAPGIGDPSKFGTFRLANAPIFVGDPIASSSISVGQNLEGELTITLPHPTPPGTTQIFLTSLKPDLVLLGQPVSLGTTQVIVPAGESTVTIFGTFAQGMASSGSVEVSVAAVGYGNGTVTVNLAPSGIVLEGPNGVGNSFTASKGSNIPLIVSAARLNSSLEFVEKQPVRGGFSATVPLSSSDITKGTVAPASVTIAGGDVSANATFTAVETGPPNPTITAGTPPGFLTPGGTLPANKVTVTVTGVTVTPIAATVGQNLETPTFVTFTPAPDNLTMTLTSNDPSKLLFSLLPGDAGTPTLDVAIEAGRTRSRDFFVHGLTNSGSATYSVNIHQQQGAPTFNFGSGTGTVNFAPSAFAIQGPFGLGQPFITTNGADNTPLTIFSAMVIGGGLEEQAVRGGLTVNVPVVSSNTAVGTITTSPVVFTGGVSFLTTAFDPTNTAPSNSQTTVSITTPPGFGTAPVGASLVVTVTVPSLSCTDGISIGKSLQSIGTVLLQQPAPTGGLAVTLTSNSANVRLSLSPTTAGSGSIVVNIPANQSSATYFIQALTDTGTGTYTCTAPLYNPDTSTVGFVPSGVVIEGPFGFGFPLITTVAQGQRPVKVTLYALVPGSNATDTNVGAQPLAGGQSLVVTLANSNPAIGTVPATVTIAGGTDSVITQFTPLSVGQTTISVIKPAAFSQPSDNTTLTARVNP